MLSLENASYSNNIAEVYVTHNVCLVEERGVHNTGVYVL